MFTFNFESEHLHEIRTKKNDKKIFKKIQITFKLFVFFFQDSDTYVDVTLFFDLFIIL